VWQKLVETLGDETGETKVGVTKDIVTKVGVTKTSRVKCKLFDV
jgi:hypothetical protein